ncbi:hypothetical protein CW706_03045 [Candidatus Bathyarchaeota archaeon]|nr:MAG: hypothetical protein CW706_03045 [Candidatus Bathyarchaeota archaeon]
MKRAVGLLVLLVLMLPAQVSIQNVAAQEIPRPKDLVVASIWGPETVDPAWCYDTASAEVIQNIYDTLIRFAVNRSLPPEKQGLTDKFEPCLATEWVIAAPPHPDAPPYTNSTYYFKIREGVKWHDSKYGTVKPSDVEYSFERWMVLDRSGGPTWMIYEPLLEAHGADWSDPEWPEKIDHAVESNATHVWFNLKAPNYPPMIFMQILAQSWASVMPNEWAYEHGCWPGEAHPEENPYTNETMTKYYDPEVSPLDDWPPGTGGRIECGSGPYKLAVLDSIEHIWKIERFPDYWKGWPAPGCEGYLETVTFYGIDEWGTRKTMFLAGDADFCYVPRAHLPELVTNWEEKPSWEEEEYPAGIRCFPGLPTLIESNLFFNFKIETAGNKYIGDPPYDELHESGIPSWFFSDVNVRKAFAYAFDYDTYIKDVFLGEAKQPATPHVEGLAYDKYIWDVGKSDLNPPDTVLPPPYDQPLLPNGSGPLPPVPKYYHDLEKAENYFKAAYDGELWEKGFTFSILYNTGNEARETAARMLKEAVESLNPKFHINVIEVDWPTYLNELVAKRLTLFIIGWLADYPDPHNWYYPYMYSEGTFAYFQSYGDPEVDELVLQGVRETDDNKRIEIYWKLGNKYFEDVPSVPLYQDAGRHWERTWVAGWYYNPIYPGPYFYHLWKGWYTPTPTAPLKIKASILHGSSIRLSSEFFNPATKKPASGFIVFVQKSLDNKTWTNVGALITDKDGRVDISITPPLGTTYYRLNFTGYKAPTPVSDELTGTVLLNAKYYEKWIEKAQRNLLSQIVSPVKVETKILEDILSSALSPIREDVDALSDKVTSLTSEVEKLQGTISSQSNMLYASIGIAIIAIIIALVAIVKK